MIHQNHEVIKINAEKTFEKCKAFDKKLGKDLKMLKNDNYVTGGLNILKGTEKDDNNMLTKNDKKTISKLQLILQTANIHQV